MTMSTRPADDGGLEITIRLTAAEAEAMQNVPQLMAEAFDSHLWALGMLRTRINSRDPGSPAPVQGDWATALRDVDRLRSRLDAIRTAAIRAFMASDGNAERLAGVLRTDPAEARALWAEMRERPAGDWERWASGGS
ncbi:hypothetical protein GT755_23330 [Herbidospora sp. NEAU-GS84]|uniref:Uncharacterized protein n=1 Tax=Herbidospora solisilvae TaxID=2696284 RepID=A0A7C9N2N1_9ACTN|nr:hypothetical protein [Herbidospora solisilvae]NAS24610.1 hypothetical protein [Herbidospora solisilvae]